MLKIEGVEKKFGYRKVLKKVDFTLGAGECVLLLGKNGAGKSTLLKIIWGLQRPDAGKITFEGVKINDESCQLRQSMGVISHMSYLYGELTAEENLKFLCQLRSIPHINQEISKVLKEVGLSAFRHVPVKNFSSGMTKRLAIARLLMIEPKILFLDEPYTGLDIESTHFFNKFLADFRDRGGTILMVTHQIETGFPLSDRLAILQDGKIIQHKKEEFAGPEEFILEYQNILHVH